MKEIENILEKNNWRIYKESNNCWELESWSDLGEDLIETIEFNGTKKDFINQFENMANSFDVDDHVEMCVSIRGNHGVPDCTISELLDDAKGIQKLYFKTLKELKRKV